MKKPIFEGVGTALITPFKNDCIDYATMARLIERQISAGVGALIVGGTTGEAATLTDKERRELYSWAREYTEGKIPLILGTGSPSTKAAVEYTRYAAELGYRGYPELQTALKESIRGSLTSLQRMEMAHAATGADAFARSMHADMENIKKTLAETDASTFDTIAEKLIGARRIYVIGARSSLSLAIFLDFYLSQLFDDVRLVQIALGGEVFDRLLSVGEEDVIVGISFPRYSRRTVDALDYSRKQGAYVCAITDSAHSPLVPLADTAVFAHNDNEGFVDSLVAPMAVVNALVAAIAAKRPKESAARLSRLERLWDEYSVYNKTR